MNMYLLQGGVTMLNTTQKECLKRITLYEHSAIEKNGKSITHKGTPFVVPTFVEIRDIVFKTILDKGFSNIDFVNPNKANCIVRVFIVRHFPAEGLMFNAYGAQCYTKTFGQWYGKTFGQELKIDFSKQVVRHWIFQDE